MKSSWFAIGTAVLFVASSLVVVRGAFAQQQPEAESKACPGAGCTGQPAAASAADHPSPDPATATVEKPVFHVLAEFSQELNVKKLKPGQKIKAEVTQAVLWHGKIIIPAESKLVGHVTEVKTRDADSPESRLGFVFDRVSLPRHQEMDFQGVVQALSPPSPRRSRVDEPDQMLPPSALTPTQNSPGAMGTVPARGSSASASRTMSVSSMPAGVPVYVDGTPGTSPGNSMGGDLKHNGTAHTGGESKPMSVGMPRGVFGIKGISLSAGPSSETPGPVVISNVGNVKLDNGVQVLLKISDPIVRKP